MPKDISERIIDSPFAPATRGGTVAIGGGGGGGGGGATNLDALTDVTLSAPSSGQTLSYNGSQWVNAAAAAMAPHGLSSSFHTGLLNWSLINFSGSNLSDIATRQHIDLQGIGPNDHHNQVHVLATGTALGGDHTISGAAAGEVLRALTSTTAAFDVLHHTDLDNILPDQHHPWLHDIITGAPIFGVAHTITGSQFQVVGATAVNTLGLLTPTPTPGAAAAILRTDSSGGIQLDTNLFYVDAANNWIGINVVPGAGPAGGAAALDILAFSNADHTQRIRQKSGQTGRLWRIENTAGHELIVMDSDGSLMSGNPLFVSGLAGWNITPEGNAEFNNIWARGELHATVFVKDEVHATGGTLLVATAGVLHDDAVISSSTVDDDTLVIYSTPAGMGVPLQVVTTSGTFTGTELHVSWIGNFINVNDPPSGPGFYFQPGDVIRSKTEVPTGVTDFWLEVISATQYSGYSTYSVYKRSGTDGTLPKGSAVVSYGKEGDGRILLTSDLQFAPYIDVFTVGTNVWTGAAGAVKERMRMGRLDGIKVPGIQGVEQYGMIAGKDLTDANSGYLIASNLQFSLYKVDIRLNNGTSDTGLWTADGNLKIGSNVGAAATTGLSVYTTGGRSGDVVIGNEATGNFLRWQQATGILTVTGSLIVSDPGTTVTKIYVDNQDAAYDNLAGGTYNSNGVLGGYALVGQTNSQNYSEARRITGVTGTWTSTTANQVSWTGPGSVLTATLANGGSRSIAAGNTGTMSVRTYLYVNVSLGGTLTMIPLNTPAVSQPNYVLIAVCDPGIPKASVTVVAGTTFISGANIATGSIQATNIAVGTITADRLDAATLTSSYLEPIDTKAQLGVTNAATADAKAVTADGKAVAAAADAAAANTAAGNAQTNAQAYSDARRVVGVTGTWTAVDGNTISWSNLVVKFAGTGVARTITSQSNVTLSPAGRWYLYINVTGTGTITMEAPVQLLGAIDQNYALIAVVDTGTEGSTPKASISVVAGSTYISGDNIQTGSIIAAKIAARTITTPYLNVDRLDGMRDGTIFTGILELDATSNIHSAGKSYNSGTNGFFLGNNGGQYRFEVGNINTSVLQWDGANLSLTMRQAIQISNTSTGQFLSLSGPGSAVGLLTLNSSSVIVSSNTFNAPLITSNKFIQTGDTFQIQTERAVAAWNSPGFAGEMCWDLDGTGILWLYLCQATNVWRRIQFPLTTW